MKQHSLRILRFALVLAMAMTVLYAPALVDWMAARPSPNVRLYAAIGSRDLSRFDVAIAEGASVHARTADDSFPLIEAAGLGQLQMVQRLIAAGVDLDAVDAHGMTAIMRAAMQDHVKVVELLMRHGADTSRRDHRNRTAFDVAEDTSSTRCARVLRSGCIRTNVVSPAG